MNYKKILLIFIFYLGLSSFMPYCYASNKASQQISDALNKWFNKTTLIASGALVGSALLGMAIYKAITQWFVNYINPHAKETEESVETQEIPYDVIEQLRSSNWAPRTIQKLRQNTTYKDYLDEVLTDHYYQEIQNALERVPMRQREQWIDAAQNLLIRSKKDETNNGWELGRSGTKMKALRRINNALMIPYDSSKPYQSPEKLLLPQKTFATVQEMESLPI